MITIFLSNRAPRCSLKMWSGEFEGHYLQRVVVVLRPLQNHICFVVGYSTVLCPPCTSNMMLKKIWFFRAGHPLASVQFCKLFAPLAVDRVQHGHSDWSVVKQPQAQQIIILHQMVYLQFHGWIQFNFLLISDVYCWCLTGVRQLLSNCTSKYSIY